MANTTYLGGTYNATFSGFQGGEGCINGGPRSINLTATEATVAPKIDGAGVLSLMQILVTATTTTVGTNSMTARKNLAAGNQTVSWAFGTTGRFQDVTHTDAVVAGDKIDIALVNGGSTNTITFTTEGFQFDGTSASVSLLYAQDVPAGVTANAGTASVTRFLPAIGGGDNSVNWFLATEATAQTYNTTPQTLSRLGTNIQTNTSTNAVTLTSRVNAGNGNQTITIGAGTTGYMEDTTHTDAVVAADLLDVQCVTGAGTVNANVSFIVMTATGGNDMRWGSTRVAGQGISNTVTNFFGIAGQNVFPFATEASAQTQFPYAASFSNLMATVSVTNPGAAQSMTFRKNTVSGNQTISINPTVLGTVIDTTHTDSVAINDLIDFQLPAIGTGTFSFKTGGVSASLNTAINVGITGVSAFGNARDVSITASGSASLLQSAATAHAGTVAGGLGVPIFGQMTTGVARAPTTTSSGSPTLTQARSITQFGLVQGIGQSPSNAYCRTWGTYR